MTADDPDIQPAPPGVDPVLIARMTGRLGDARTIRRKASDLAAAMCEPLQTTLDETAGFKAIVERGSVELGMRSEFEAADGAGALRCSAAIHGWCHDFSFSTATTLAVAFVESLLGGTENEPVERSLTPVERDISILLFERLLSVFRAAAGATDGKATTGSPEMAAPDPEDERPDVHSVRITLTVSFGALSAPVSIILPQTAVMKVEVTMPSTQLVEAPQAPPDWVERLTRQVSRSDVTLKALIRLEPLTLGTVSRLQPGDVIAFADSGEVNVHLRANGRELGVCELGRSGARYMLRLKPAESLEDELARDFLR